MAVGIPGRTWYKHIVFAPGLWAGYGAATLPILTEAVDTAQRAKTEKDWENVRMVAEATAEIISRVASTLRLE